MDENVKLSHSSDVAFSKVEDEYILMSLERGSFYILDGPAAEIWHNLKKPTSFGKVLDTLVQTFDVDRETCAEDAAELISDLVDKKLVIAG